MKSFTNLFSPNMLIILILAITVIIIFNRISKKYYFVCPRCGRKFKASPGKLMTSIHAFDKHNIRCPYCGEKKFMKQIKE